MTSQSICTFKYLIYLNLEVMHNFSFNEFRILHLELKSQQTFSMKGQTVNIFDFLYQSLSQLLSPAIIG